MNPKLKEQIERFAAKGGELENLIAKGADATADDKSQIKALDAELDALQAEITEQKSLVDIEAKTKSRQAFLNDPANVGKVKVIGYEDAGQTEIDEKKGTIEHTGKGLIPLGKMKILLTPEYKEAFSQYLLVGEKKMSAEHMKALQDGIDDEGGAFVPPDWTLDVIRREPTPTSLSTYVRQWQTTRDAKLFPKVPYTGASDDSNATLYSTGVRVTYPGEAPTDTSAIDATEPQTGTLRIDVHTAMLALSITNDLLEDAAIDMNGFLQEIFQETVGLEYDSKIANGTGIGRAKGIIANPGSSATGDEPQYIVSGAAAALTADGIKDLAFGLAPQYLRNARFAMNWLSTAHAIDELKDGDGNYLWSMGNQDNRLAANILDRRLLGFPVGYSEFMPNVGAGTYPIIFGDFMAYYLVQRIGFSIQVLRETKAKLNQIELVGRLRFGGRVAKPWALKCQKVST